MYKRKAICSILIAAVMAVLLFSGHTALAEESVTGRIVNCTNNVNVRKGPGTNYVKVGVAPKNALYPVLGQSGDWVQIRFQGAAAYVHGDYIRLEAVQPPEQNNSSAQTGTIINCSTSVNVRKGPGTGYAKLGVALKGAFYQVLGKSGSWYKIDYKGSTGYISADYLKVSSGVPASPAPGSQTGKIVNCTTSVNVRSGPSTSYSKLGVALKGAVYPVKGKSGSFYAIEYGGKTGYVSASYLSVTSAPTPAPIPTPTPAPIPTPTPAPAPAGGKIILGYYASWAAHSGYTPDRIPEGVTHVNYAFANIGTDYKIKMGDPATDPVNFEKLRKLKRQRPELKTLISVGGWTWSQRFSDAALTDARRTAFANSVVAFITQHGFDGVDIDWEYPVGGGLPENVIRPEDKTNFTLLMKKLREKLDAQGALDGRHYLLSFAGASGAFYAQNTELKKLAGYVDFATVMTYDMHGPWPGSFTDFNAPLYTPSENTPQYKWSCNAAVKLWTDEGFPKTKLIMGIPFYGIKFDGVTNLNRGLYQRFTSGSSIPYDEIASDYLDNPAYTQYEHPDALVPWLFDGSTFISYDDVESVSAKGEYIKDTGLGGAAIWELSQSADGTLFGALYEAIR